MKQRLLSEALYQVAALIIAVIVVHAAYVAVIRPNADLIQEQQNVLQQTDPNFVPERSVYIIMRDFEQETCIILIAVGSLYHRHEGSADIEGEGASGKDADQCFRWGKYIARGCAQLCATGSGFTGLGEAVSPAQSATCRFA